jgi:hypothetical protein
VREESHVSAGIAPTIYLLSVATAFAVGVGVGYVVGKTTARDRTD